MFADPQNSSERKLLALSKKELSVFYIGIRQIELSEFSYLRRCVINNAFKDGVPSETKADDAVRRLALIEEVQASRQNMTLLQSFGVEQPSASYPHSSKP